MKSRNAFTLIELLVVVAVISILAAIALPNFLEAQTRAKVSRAKSDLRSIATGIEAFTVDHNRPPIDVPPVNTNHDWATSFSQLTTPVAYLTSVLRDPFTAKDNPFNQQIRSFDYGTLEFELQGKTGAAIAQTNDVWHKAFGESLWKIGSAGPDLEFNDGEPQGAGGSFYGFNARYDPTNGTISLGDVYRSMARVEG